MRITTKCFSRSHIAPSWLSTPRQNALSIPIERPLRYSVFVPRRYTRQNTSKYGSANAINGSNSATASQRRDQSALTKKWKASNGATRDPMEKFGMPWSISWLSIIAAAVYCQRILDDITRVENRGGFTRKPATFGERSGEQRSSYLRQAKKRPDYRYINREWEVVCNLPREQVIGSTDYDLFPDRDCGAVSI